MLVKIEERREYELHVKNTVAKMQVSGKHKAIVRKLIMRSFDDGVKFAQNELKIEV